MEPFRVEVAVQEVAKEPRCSLNQEKASMQSKVTVCVQIDEHESFEHAVLEKDTSRMRKPTYRTAIKMGKEAAHVAKENVAGENGLAAVFLMYRIFVGTDLNSSYCYKNAGKRDADYAED